MKIGKGLRVRLEYQLRVKGGDVIESSAKSGPLQYVQGEGKMLAGLEKRLEGLSPGDERAGEIPAAEAFGTEESLPVKAMTRQEFPAGVTPKPGLVLQAKGPRGEDVSFKVIAVTTDQVTVRLLHPLVGRDLEFTVKVLSVSDPGVAVAKAPGSSSGARANLPPVPSAIVELDLDELLDT
jgi:FKBP-type peptidyl-prolyl cis-trans isomerase 2